MLLALVTLAGTAHANLANPVGAGLGGSVCASSSAHWNAPNGALVSARSGTHSPVNRAITSMGGYRTHTMLSNGPDWITHAAIKVQSRSGSSACQYPEPLVPSSVSYGGPGASQINNAAVYDYLFVNDGVEYLVYQPGNADGTNKGAAIANWAWSTMPYASKGTAGYQLLTPGGKSIFYKMGELAQFSYRYESDGRDGTICSEFAWSLQYRYNDTVPPTVPPFWCIIGGGPCQYQPWVTVPHQQSADALNAFYNQVRSICLNENVGIVEWVGTPLACGVSASDICTRAANQMTNCIAWWTDACSDNYVYAGGSPSPVYDSPWKMSARASSFTANTLSPDQLSGWAPYTTDFSTWDYSGDFPVTWNSSGGAVYGCWN